MAHYRLSHIDLSTRIALGVQMLDPAREWGKVSELARQYGVSRKFLYEMAGEAQQALQRALAPKEAGRRPQTTHLVVDGAVIGSDGFGFATDEQGNVLSETTLGESLAIQHTPKAFAYRLCRK